MPLFRLDNSLSFPHPSMAGPEGLLAVGGDLSIERLLAAYRAGIFPWYCEGEPILWWSPDPRLVLFPSEFHLPRRMARILKQGVFAITVDRAFAEVIAACADQRGPNRDETWITPEMREAYCRLHEAGFAHSFECWRQGRLVGGLYGVSLGGCFFGESMFSKMANASKAAFAELIARAIAWNFDFIDCQVATGHLMSLGAREVPRATFLDYLRESLMRPTIRGAWDMV